MLFRASRGARDCSTRTSRPELEDPLDDADRRPPTEPDRQADLHDRASTYVDSIGRGAGGFGTVAGGGTPLNAPIPDRDPLAARSGWAIATPLLLVLGAGIGIGIIVWRAFA
ncbi:hypothetical protein SAMN06264364_14124 [Quadrisphaera granulorum]|uniref:Uncharacterized protein n=1 Tax=Quadrisphaera granulorum TaxID=317664 RepID=A0A316ABC8_9ACTN|nr:hypothetical protein [Quadrisphaera granulorum]PWJ47127.1 hypothetical protein BXY45_14124 [Quadrisphaera granulorum]SZE98931.1 hypothetical protein SAMN06264364_14124 [Quadrisphaera granulorum]